MAREAFYGPGDPQQVGNSRVFLRQALQIRGEFYRLFQGDPRPGRDQFGDPVHLAVGKTQRPPDVPDRPAGGHGPEGNNLGHVVGAVFLLYVFDDLPPPFITEINIKIGHGDPFRVQEAFKKQLVFQRVKIGNPEQIPDQAACGRPAAGAHHDPAFLGLADKIPDNQEISNKTHLFNDRKFIDQPLLYFRSDLRVTPGQSFPAKVFKVGIGVKTFGNLESRQVVMAQLQLDVATVGNPAGVRQGLRDLRKDHGHLLRGPVIKEVGREAHPVFVVDGFARLDTEQNIVGPGVFPP